jgi:hypothetical protein
MIFFLSLNFKRFVFHPIIENVTLSILKLKIYFRDEMIILKFRNEK